MKSFSRFVRLTVSCFLPVALAAQTTHRPLAAVAAKSTPFQTNNGLMPKPGQYPGPYFVLNHAWPTRPLPPLVNPPWRVAIHNGTINTQNAGAYADALRKYVSVNARNLILNYKTWDAAKAHWYNEPWLGGQREAISGTYAAGEFGPGIFPGTGLRTQFNTNVLTYYDERAAYTLSKVWGTSAMTPHILPSATQFEEGSVIVKVAVFASETQNMQYGWWDAMNGAQVWPLYIGVGAQGTSPAPPPQVWSGYVAQFDIIVKDSKSAPKTGWVFTTLVYDSRLPGDAWDKMIPLGAQWGNDPQATQPGQPLTENWNSPKAPLYATQTLGWGGRLSGPNDGARNNIAINGKVLLNEPDSSCMSCHSTAQWNSPQHKMVTFLLPSFATNSPPGFQLCGNNGQPDPNGTNICSPAVASTEWLKWYKNRLGTQPMDMGSVATDFDEVLSFKSLRYWWQSMAPPGAPMPMLMETPSHGVRFNQYTGAPLPNP
jgi:hypothetical protein